MYFSKVKAENL